MKVLKNHQSCHTADDVNHALVTTKTRNTIQTVPLGRLVPHPDSPNCMSKAKIAKLVRNIECTDLYEPLIVRPCPQTSCDTCPNKINSKTFFDSCNDADPQRSRCYQILNGHQRAKALAKLGYAAAEVIVWDVDDEQADILLTTLNRLCGSDVLAKKHTLLKRLNEKLETCEMAKLLPQSAKQIERLADMKLPESPAPPGAMPAAMVLFVSPEQQQTIERAISLAGTDSKAKTRAARKSAALALISEAFIETNNKASAE